MTVPKEIVTTVPFLKPNGRLSEGVGYDFRNCVLSWVDIIGKKVHWVEYLGQDAAKTWKTHKWVSTADSIGVLGLTNTPLVYAVAAKKGFGFIDIRSCSGRGEEIPIDYKMEVDHDLTKMRFNDGSIDPAGHFFAGSMFDFGCPKSTDGKLYIWNPTSTAQPAVVADSLAIPNGIGFSPDGKLMYFVDSLNYTIWQYDYEASSHTMSNKRVFAKIEDVSVDSPEPDGLCVSTDGHVWVAVFSTGTVRRYTPAGEWTETYSFPAKRVTCVAFGGVTMSDLFVTTAHLHSDDENPAPTPGDEGGQIFRVAIENTQGVRKNILSSN